MEWKQAAEGMKTHDAIVIGAGISGLACALKLTRAGKDVAVLERSNHIGGAMRSQRIGKYLVEAGPNSALETTPLLGELMDAAGCKDELLYADAASDTRYIVKHGELTPLPMSPGAFIKTKLFSASTKLGLLREPFIKASPDDAEETIAQFVVRRLGREFLDYAINPFVAGVYAGDPEQLSVKAAFPKLYALEQKYGSLIKGQIKGARERKQRAEQSKQAAKMFTFRNGMQSFPLAIARQLGEAIRTECAIDSIAPSECGLHRVTTIHRDRREEFVAPILILSVPAYAASEIMKPVDVDAANALQSIPYPPCSVVITCFRREAVRHSLGGFGYLIPQVEKRKILGTIFTSTIFPERCPEGEVMVTSFVGGSRSPELALQSEEKLVSIVCEELRSLVGAEGTPSFQHVTSWERAIPQYTIGHLDRIATLERFEQRFPGWFFCANYKGGISVGDCVKSADDVSERALCAG